MLEVTNRVFVDLIQLSLHGDGNLVMVNVASISYVAKEVGEYPAYVVLSSGPTLIVNETYEQIINALTGEDDA